MDGVYGPRRSAEAHPHRRGTGRKDRQLGFRTGIVGLPNVGKSTLFNALTGTAAAQAANYPFCTIEPNLGEVAVPDKRLDDVARIAGSPAIVPATMTFVDIAGLVKGASKGDGLGNQFLASIREVDAVAHVARCFEDDDVVHVDGAVDPVSDIEVVETELALADLESVERRLAKLARKVRGGDKEAVVLDGLLRRAGKALERGDPARTVVPDAHEAKAWRGIQLITAKPVLYVCNVEEESAGNGNRHSAAVADLARRNGAGCVAISALIEEQIAQLGEADAAEYLAELGCGESGLSRLIRHGYELLGLRTFFTAGPKEARAWTVPAGTDARTAAGTIHGDFMRGFIRAETASYDDFVACGGEQGARAIGKLRSEGRTYEVQDGDVIRFLFNV